ncbi:hypothetical protein GF385_02370 [Candidatus Dependentiae bacterium]|nr:hypothetical protein [Candidatus Dependentiae bacterium]
MKYIKYLLIFSVFLSSLNAAEQAHTHEEEQTKSYTENNFEEFVKKTKADDINRISITIDIDKNKEYPETWKKIFESFVECSRNIQEIENQNFGKLTEFLSTIYDNTDKLHGKIGISALTKPEKE